MALLPPDREPALNAAATALTPVAEAPLAQLLRLLSPATEFDARRAVEWLVRQALDHGASDLHLRPCDTGVEILLRVDGVLTPRWLLAPAIYERLATGLKNMARVASFRKSLPQDGRLEVDGREVRVATGPSHFGEKLTLRLPGTLEGFGSDDELDPRWQRALREPQGLLLASGPAGSGKTTTLYRSLLWLWRGQGERLGAGARLNVVTLEDPVERVIPEFTQTQVQAAAGMTFASGLRAVLRQDPDVILVGEIRDSETAAAAVASSLTGHLVLSTLHARDALGVIPRLLEMGVEGYPLSAGLAAVTYQRLLRRLCPACAEQRAGVWTATGCPECAGSGYRGRLAAAETAVVSAALRQLILDRAPLGVLRQQAEQDGMVPLSGRATELARTGATSGAEAERVVGSG